MSYIYTHFSVVFYTHKQKDMASEIACGHVKPLRMRIINRIIDTYIHITYTYMCVYFLFVSAQQKKVVRLFFIKVTHIM